MRFLQAVFAISPDGVLPMSMNPELQDALLKGKRTDPYYIANGSFDVLKDTNVADFLPEGTGLFVLEAQDYTYEGGSAGETRHPIHVRFSGVKVTRLATASYAVLWGQACERDNDTACGSTADCDSPL
jgi:hypothetical protein